MASAGLKTSLLVFTFDARLAKIDFLGGVVVKAIDQVVSGQLLEVLHAKVAVASVPRTFFLLLLCNVGLLIEFAIEIIETSHPGRLGNQLLVCIEDLTAIVIKLCDFPTFSCSEHAQ